MSNKIRWTNPQQDAISARGGTLLISAAAGSGKTAVLSQRAVERMLDREQPIDADRLLVATFSKAAAKEMRHRIITKLNEAIEQNPSDPAPRRQRQLVERAQISTIHSFCLELIRQNFQLAGVSPNFRVGETMEIEELLEDTLSELLEERYSSRSPIYLQLVELLSNGKNDSNLSRTVLETYEFLRSLPFYRQWAEQRLALYRPQPIGESIWGQEVIAYISEAVQYGLALVEQGLQVISSDEALEASYKPAFMGDRVFLELLSISLKKGDWDGAALRAKSFSHVSLGRKKVSDEASKEHAKEIRDRIKELVAKIRDFLMVCTQEEFQEDIADLLPKVTELFDLVLEFDLRVTLRKRELAILDYSDLEQLSLELLVGCRQGTEQYYPTTIAKELAAQFDEIMVDECQDINMVQEMIFKAISNGSNLFYVGDVKQSIYGFRQAMPQLFIDKLDSYSPYNGLSYPAKIILRDNFRSRREVTEPINLIFTMIMSRRIGGIDYTPEDYLNSAAEFPSSKDCGWELHLLDKKDLEGDMVSHEQEAAYVATLVSNMLHQRMQVNSPQGLRPIEPGDICILLRSPKSVIEYYRKAFAGVGVQSAIDVGGEFLTTLEIRAMLNLLKAIDNPLLDVELAGAMLSPIFGFTAEELAAIRLLRRRGAFYNAIRYDTSAKTVQFAAALTRFRQLASSKSVTQLIATIYQDTLFDLRVRAMQGGEQRYANLMLFAEYIEGFEKRGVRGLSGVIKTFENMRVRGKDLEPAVVSGSANAVTIMSIHKSKGLEFPVVILANAAGRFNKNDLISNTMLDSDMGFACVRRDPLLKKQFPTLPLVAARIKNTTQLLSEEMRLLYVALTRAKEKMIVTASINKPTEIVPRLWCDIDQGRLPAYTVRDQSSYIEWIMSCILHMPGVAQSLMQGWDYNDPHMKVIFAKRMPPVQKGEEASETLREPHKIDEALLTQITAQCSFIYPYPKATTAPTKLSVSELAKDHGQRRMFTQTPKFVLNEELSPAERGSAVHLYMQFCRLDQAAADPAAELTRMGEMGILTPRQVRAVDLEKIERFFESNLWQTIGSAHKLLREYKFISPARNQDIGEYTLAEDGEPTMLQGIADMIVIRDNKATLIDFKTDRISSPSRLAEAYRRQLVIYRDMIKSDLGLEVEGAYLYSFHMDREVQVF